MQVWSERRETTFPTRLYNWKRLPLPSGYFFKPVLVNTSILRHFLIKTEVHFICVPQRIYFQGVYNCILAPPCKRNYHRSFFYSYSFLSTSSSFTTKKHHFFHAFCLLLKCAFLSILFFSHATLGHFVQIVINVWCRSSVPGLHHCL